MHLQLSGFHSSVSSLLLWILACPSYHKLVILVQTFSCTFMHHTTSIHISSPVYREQTIHISTSLMNNVQLVHCVHPEYHLLKCRHMMVKIKVYNIKQLYFQSPIKRILLFPTTSFGPKWLNQNCEESTLCIINHHTMHNKPLHINMHVFFISLEVSTFSIHLSKT